MPAGELEVLILQKPFAHTAVCLVLLIPLVSRTRAELPETYT